MDASQGLRPPAGAITIESRGGRPAGALPARGRRHRGRDAVHDLAGAQRVVVDAIDAGGVTFVSSSALALLLLCAEASLAAGRHPVLRAASHQVDRALQLAGIESVFPRPEPAEGSTQTSGGDAERGAPA